MPISKMETLIFQKFTFILRILPLTREYLFGFRIIQCYEYKSLILSKLNGIKIRGAHRQKIGIKHFKSGDLGLVRSVTCRI
jgi:hypothetical protein